MTTSLLFHHAQGQTKGFLAFADELREAGHTVHTPDLYDGNTFEDLDEGVAYAKKVGFDEILSRGTATATDLPARAGRSVRQAESCDRVWCASGPASSWRICSRTSE